MQTNLHAGRDGLARLVAPVDDAGAVVGSLEAESKLPVGAAVKRHLAARFGSFRRRGERREEREVIDLSTRAGWRTRQHQKDERKEGSKEASSCVQYIQNAYSGATRNHTSDTSPFDVSGIDKSLRSKRDTRGSQVRAAACFWAEKTLLRYAKACWFAVGMPPTTGCGGRSVGPCLVLAILSPLSPPSPSRCRRAVSPRRARGPPGQAS